jgi:hypothetical protein
MDLIKTIISRPIVGFLYRVFPGLRSNKELSRIKRALEQT